MNSSLATTLLDSVLTTLDDNPPASSPLLLQAPEFVPGGMPDTSTEVSVMFFCSNARSDLIGYGSLE